MLTVNTKAGFLLPKEKGIYMARIRSIKPEFFMSEDIGSLTCKARLLYVALWCHADRLGIMKFQRTAIKAQTMPFDMNDFDACLNELLQSSHAILYEAENKKYIYLPTFTDHQRPHKTEKESGNPKYESENKRYLTVNETLDVGKERERERSLGRVSRKGNGKGNGLTTQPTKNAVDNFSLFWLLYPKRKNKAQAQKAWNNITNKTETLALITEALSWQTKSQEWTKQGGQFIPYPATYLNAEAWKDEPTAEILSGPDQWLAEEMEKDALVGEFSREN